MSLIVLPLLCSPAQFDPATVVTDVLKGLCHSEQVSEICLCNDEFTNTLIAPVSQFYDNDDMVSDSLRKFTANRKMFANLKYQKVPINADINVYKLFHLGRKYDMKWKSV